MASDIPLGLAGLKDAHGHVADSVRRAKAVQEYLKKRFFDLKSTYDEKRDYHRYTDKQRRLMDGLFLGKTEYKYEKWAEALLGILSRTLERQLETHAGTDEEKDEIRALYLKKPYRLTFEEQQSWDLYWSIRALQPLDYRVAGAFASKMLGLLSRCHGILLNSRTAANEYGNKPFCCSPEDYRAFSELSREITACMHKVISEISDNAVERIAEPLKQTAQGPRVPKKRKRR